MFLQLKFNILFIDALKVIKYDYGIINAPQHSTFSKKSESQAKDVHHEVKKYFEENISNTTHPWVVKCPTCF